ncbi:uncharacterized protein BXIN_2819 [Babesia sp. Xinjiang]|uniref:uncharacterized protein n=1 Tax=Babesia sp. Xinjiang TaxID=462227 RepID=UPI000A263994|nr:uncharacterized protein BXIN_2819 [Babesia sp. Xinjiang]ORM41699.1 hypothetical protein BXIN_2819 [Babesia sp. Xinjiang]
MPESINVHVLPCLIKEPGPADVERGFTDKVFILGSPTVETEVELGGFTLRDICGSVADEVPFLLDTTEHLEQNVYTSQHGSDPLLGADRLCTFLRGRCLRGSRLNLDALGCRMAVVEASASSSRKTPLARNTSIPCQLVRETAAIESLTVWDRDTDISPIAPLLEGYKHLAVAFAVCTSCNC